MFPAPSLPWFELARFRRSRLTRAALVAVMLVPLFYGALYVWANLDPTGNLDRVRAAVVNHDKLIEVPDSSGVKQPIAVGRLLAANLISSDSEQNYDWVLTDEQDATAGLANGEYKAVLTIPENLSKAATSTAGDPQDAVQGRLDLRTNDAVNYINGTLAQSVLTAAKSALNAQVTETYLDNIYLSFSDLKTAIDEAADASAQLADGAGQLAGGARQVDEGASALADANRQIADGGRTLAGGADQLAGGLKKLDSKTASLPKDSKRLASGAKQVSGGVNEINALVQRITAVITETSKRAAGDIDRLTAALNRIETECRNATAPGVDCDLIAQAAEDAKKLKPLVDQTDSTARTYSRQTQRLADGAAQVAKGNAQLAASVPQLVDAIGQASSGSQKLANGAHALSDGAGQAATGARKLADGTGQLVDGAGQLSSGAEQLSAGLTKGGEQIPDYNKSERETLAKTAATPVTDDFARVNAVKNNGAALAPYFMALALWVGAMAIYLLLRPLSARAIASTAGSIRIALAGFAPGVALSAAQALLLTFVLEALVGLDAASTWLVLGVALMTGIVFTAINQMFIALFGGAGRFVALVFVCLQLTAAGGTYPIETAPSFFGFLHGLLPMTYSVHAFRAGIAGGTTGVGGDFFALAIFAVLALAVTCVAASRRQVVTMKRLHPTLAI